MEIFLISKIFPQNACFALAKIFDELDSVAKLPWVHRHCQSQALFWGQGVGLGRPPLHPMFGYVKPFKIHCVVIETFHF